MDQDKAQTDQDNSKEPLPQTEEPQSPAGSITQVQVLHGDDGTVRRLGAIFSKEIVFHFSER